MTKEEIAAITAKWEKSFEEKNISGEMFNAVLAYLSEVGALQYCATTSGCNGSCPSGYGCQQLHNNNCVCVRS